VIEVRAIDGLPEVEPGAPLGAMLGHAADAAAEDVIVVSQKAVSKAEGRIRELREVAPGPEARSLADELGKDPRLVQLILDESRTIVRAERGVLIAETRSGLICANAGIDSSNVPGEERVVLLPEDADASARSLRAAVRAATGVAPGLVIADSFGRAWRIGQADVAIGCAGLIPLDDWRGRRDRDGRQLGATVIAIADEVAAAGALVRDKASGAPAAVVTGLGRFITRGDGPGAAALRRAEADDLFR
jgi:coenzyme F420-0:L-glutamate ligase/coenzyme F420-1:gamma-L-glutamate ligase